MGDLTIAELYRQLKGIRLGIIVALITGLVAATAAWVTTKRDVSDLQRDVESIKADRAASLREWNEWRRSIDQKVERVVAQNDYLIQMVKELRDR